MSAVAASAMAPPMSPSRLRANTPVSGSGSRATSIDCTAAAIANGAEGETARATMSVAARMSASCPMPRPMPATMRAETMMPMLMPMTVSSTRRGRASRARPSAMIVTVTATTGTSCPRPKRAMRYAVVAATTICAMPDRDRTTRCPAARRPSLRRMLRSSRRSGSGMPAMVVGLAR